LTWPDSFASGAAEVRADQTAVSVYVNGGANPVKVLATGRNTKKVCPQIARMIADFLYECECSLALGVHSLDGPITFAALLERITGHIPHHVGFIEEKLRALGV
jgi:hypothetical protein